MSLIASTERAQSQPWTYRELPANKHWRPLPTAELPSLPAAADAGACGMALYFLTHLRRSSRTVFSLHHFWWPSARTKITLFSTGALSLLFCAGPSSLREGRHRLYLPWTASERELRRPDDADTIIEANVSQYSNAQQATIIGLLIPCWWFGTGQMLGMKLVETNLYEKHMRLKNERMGWPFDRFTPLRGGRNVVMFVGFCCMGAAVGNGLHWVWWNVHDRLRGERVDSEIGS